MTGILPSGLRAVNTCFTRGLGRQPLRRLFSVGIERDLSDHTHEELVAKVAEMEKHIANLESGKKYWENRYDSVLNTFGATVGIGVGVLVGFSIDWAAKKVKKS